MNYRNRMATVSVRLNDDLNDRLDELVEEGVFKNKTDAFHEAVRMVLMRYDGFTLDS